MTSGRHRRAVAPRVRIVSPRCRARLPTGAMPRAARWERAFVLAAVAAVACAAQAQPVVFAGDRVPAPLTATPGDAARGKAVVTQRDKGHCILCHALPEADVKFAGNVGPPLAGVGNRLDAGQIRGRIVDPTKRDPDSVMPAYFRSDNLNRVAPAYKGKTALSAQDVEDAVAYLLQLK